MKAVSHARALISYAPCLLLASAVALVFLPEVEADLPHIVTRATDSIGALFTSARSPQQQPHQQQLQQQPPVPLQQVQQQQQVLNGSMPTIPVAAHAEPMPIMASVPPVASAPVLAPFQRQLNQLNTAMLSGVAQLGNMTAVSGPKINNVIEVINNVGKAIHQQILGANGQIQIITSPAAQQPANVYGDLANTKKNEYQSIVVNDNQPLQIPNQPAQLSQQQINSTNYKEQGEILRQEIIRRANQLQQVVAGSMDVLKNSGDLIVRRLLEQMNHRLDQAKIKAERILSEPATSEAATKALFTLNQGLNNLNNIITNIVNRLDLNSKEAIQAQLNGMMQAGSQQQSRSGSNLVLDPNRIRQNLQQLGQQFSSAISAAQQQRQMIQNQQRVN